MHRDTLTPKQQRFVVEYLAMPMQDRTGKEAAIRAGFSPRCAAQQAYELMKMPKIREAIEAEQRDSLDRVRVTADEIVEGLKKEATDSDNSGGERIRAWELLGKMEGMFVERKQVTHEHHNFFANVDLSEPLPVDGGDLTALPAPDWDMNEPDTGAE